MFLMLLGGVIFIVLLQSDLQIMELTEEGMPTKLMEFYMIIRKVPPLKW